MTLYDLIQQLQDLALEHGANTEATVYKSFSGSISHISEAYYDPDSKQVHIATY